MAYGGDKLTSDTRAADFLYGQLQEGLKQNLMNCPNVYEALTLKELVMAAKNEERRQSEMKKEDDATTVQDLRRFLELAPYHRRFIPTFASVAQLLHQLSL